MRYLPVASLCYATGLKLVRPIVPICNQLRLYKYRTRKPTWLPVAPSKIFVVPRHPHVPMDEKLLLEDLLEEYERKVESLRKLFQEELKQNPDNEPNILELQLKEEEEFKLLLEENKKENERIRVIREEVLEKEFQEKQLEFLQMAEETNKRIVERKAVVEEIVRKEKEKSAAYITKDNIDAVIEKAIDNPINLAFSIGLDGSVNWEGKPSAEYETDIQSRISRRTMI